MVCSEGQSSKAGWAERHAGEGSHRRRPAGNKDVSSAGWQICRPNRKAAACVSHARSEVAAVNWSLATRQLATLRKQYAKHSAAITDGQHNLSPCLHTDGRKAAVGVLHSGQHMLHRTRCRFMRRDSTQPRCQRRGHARAVPTAGVASELTGIAESAMAPRNSGTASSSAEQRRHQRARQTWEHSRNGEKAGAGLAVQHVSMPPAAGLQGAPPQLLAAGQVSK